MSGLGAPTAGRGQVRVPGGAVQAEPVVHQEPQEAGTTQRALPLEPGTPVIARAHHGSVSKEQRLGVERDLKAGRLRCVVATSSLELGIDMGSIDLVLQVSPPPSVASGLQRVGRADHRVGGRPRGVIYPVERTQLVDAVVMAEGMLSGAVERTSLVTDALDVLAQHTVAAACVEDLEADDWYATVRRAAPYADLPRSAFDSVVTMVSGGYASADLTSLSPLLVHDRRTERLTARPGAQRLAVAAPGTIPDRGVFPVVLPEGAQGAGRRRVGELDEEMVNESRPGDVITLGTSSWRVREITRDRVVVDPAPGRSARLPFWRGEGPGRPAATGAAKGAFLREAAQALEDPDDPDGPGDSEDPDGPGKAGRRADGGVSDGTGGGAGARTGRADGGMQRLLARLAEAGLDSAARDSLVSLLREQRAATGVLPCDTTLVLERYQEADGSWRLVLHSPYGSRVHEPWAVGVRERAPLWLQRLRASQLLEASQHLSGLPVVTEAARECLQDVYDLPALHDLMSCLATGEVRVVEAPTRAPSPFACPLLLGYEAAFLYQDDLPLTERRTRLLSLDPRALASLVGDEGLADILDDAVVAEVDSELQRLTPSHRVRADTEGVADLLRELGPLSTEEIAQRCVPARSRDASGDGSRDSGDSGQDGLASEAAPVGGVRRVVTALPEARRAVPLLLGGREVWARAEDVPVLHEALGTDVPGWALQCRSGLPGVPGDPGLQAPGQAGELVLATEAATDGDRRARTALEDLVLRRARTRCRTGARDCAQYLGLEGQPGHDRAARALEHLEEEGLLVRLPDSGGTTWMATGVLDRGRRRSLARARAGVAPVPPQALQRLVADRAGLLVAQRRSGSLDDDRDNDRDDGLDMSLAGALARGVDALAEVLPALEGMWLSASLWESVVLPSRVSGYRPAMLDELVASGDVVWQARGGQEGGAAAGAVEVAFFPTDSPLAPVPGPPLEAGLSGQQPVLPPGLAEQETQETRARLQVTPPRRQGARVVLLEGEPVLSAPQNLRTLVCYTASSQTLGSAVHALVTWERDLASRLPGPTSARRRVVVEQVNGITARDPAVSQLLREAGLVQDPRGMRLRPAAPRPHPLRVSCAEQLR
ncbi:Lhr family ATP-dependent helicase [Actinomyces wuliandei]|uniref:Lhr family ATP-dependent helicase n=1 Tax=Actinomyces wuliandei TaxID=2057743 RepID=UPI001FA9B59A|nr:helicase-related protein [Actinomyces wuliandei]